MAFRFAGFELDEAQRELRFENREIALQPRVLDLLLYLVRNRERVVPKDELLDMLWPGSVVVDGALQRVVSLARSALQQGGARDAIRTFPRHGYRFCATLSVDGSEREVADAPAAVLQRARDLYHAHDWSAALEAFREADARAALAGADLERWAQAAQWAGKSGSALEPLERAVAAHLSRKDKRGAARAALMLGQICFERMEIDVARGWHQRAAALLDPADVSRELGLLHVFLARFGLLDGELEQALEHAERAHAIGLELEDPDIEGLGLMYSGHALVAMGEINRGLDLQNEAAAAVLAGQITPWIGGLIYCGVIWVCRNRADWGRAAEWTDQFARWCARSGLVAFPGTCRLHRAEVLSVCGEIAEAETEIAEASELLATWAPWAEGDAHRVLGDLRLAKGELDGAEEAFRRAHALGWDPEPGYAMLRLERGQAEAAAQALAACVADRNWANRERRGLLLAHFVVVACAADWPDAALDALGELDEHPELWATPALTAAVHRARAELAWSEAKPADAIAELRRAIQGWREVGSSLQTAHLQMRLAEMLIASGAREAAELELEAAAGTFGRLGAARPMEQCRRRIEDL